MQRRHSPAYVAEIRKRWRVVVPIRGRLAPRVCPEEFETQHAALGSGPIKAFERAAVL